jgi:hypothetical protein
MNKNDNLKIWKVKSHINNYFKDNASIQKDNGNTQEMHA